MPLLENYPNLKGSRALTTALANLLTQAGIHNPEGAPWDEAMLLGISGGLGCGYILWEFKSMQSAALVLAFGYRWNYSKEALQQAAERVGGAVTWKETGGAKAAAKHLNEALDNGKAVLAWTDPYFLPHRGLPSHTEGCGVAYTNICGREGDQFMVHDHGLFSMTPDELATARGRVGSYKNRLMLVEPGQPMDLEAAIRAGLADHVDYLSQPSQSFSIPAIAKWAKLMTDPRNKKGWRKVFANGNGLYNTLVSIYTGIEHNGAGGLRNLYADFLKQADGIVGGLQEAEQAYRAAAAAWTRVAETVIAPFPEARELHDQRKALLADGDAAGLKTCAAEIEALRVERDQSYTEPDGLFETIQSRLNEVVAAEKAALAAMPGA